MTKPQINLLSACIEAHGLAAHTKLRRMRLVEIGLSGGISRRTAQSLVDAGLLEMEANELNQVHVSLSSDLLTKLTKEDEPGFAPKQGSNDLVTKGGSKEVARAWLRATGPVNGVR